MHLDTGIHIVIVVPDPEPSKASPLQGFARSLCENSWMIRTAARVPSDVLDLTPQGQSTLLARRKAGVDPVHWYGQTPRALRSQPVPDSVPFLLVFLPNDQDPLNYQEWARSSSVRPTIVAEHGGDLEFSQLNQKELQQRFLDLCNLLPESFDADSVRDLKEAIQAWVLPASKPLGYRVGGHNSVAPNLMALQSAGFKDMVYGPFRQIGQGPQPYVEQIVKTAETILELRNSVLGTPLSNLAFGATQDVNLFAPAMFPHVFSTQTPSSLDRKERSQFLIARRILEKQRGYGFSVQTEAQRDVIFGSPETVQTSGKVAPHPLFSIRRLELDLSTDCVAALAVSELAPVLRLPNDVNRSSGAVRNFATSYRSASPNPLKRARTFAEVQQYLANAVPKEFLELISAAQSGVRIISDAHLEWLDVDGLPLCLKKSTTRIPVTPGNLFIQTLTAVPPVILTPGSLSQVLVLSALDRTEPIRRMFEIAFSAFEQHWEDRLQVTFREVACEEDLVNALNEFRGSIVVFDGHGAHEPNEPAKLYMKGKAVDVWEMKERAIRIPPIVLLSACDTHAADRNHATTGNGFLSLGARSVLASVFPLDAIDAATFVARLLFRIAIYVPIATKVLRRSIRWNEVVSGMLQMQLLTDFLRSLLEDEAIDEITYKDVHFRGNNAINGGDGPPKAKPFDFVIDCLTTLGIERKYLKSALEIAVANSSAISYIQLGRPETILINDDDIIATPTDMAEVV